MNFITARERLLAELRDRLQNGEVTERALARRLGLSQPHINNVLRGRRNLSPEIADLLLNSFHYSLLDLFSERELQSHVNSLQMPATPLDVGVLKRPLGPGHEWEAVLDSNLRYRSPIRLAASPYLLMARVSSDARMFPILGAADMALLDTSPSARRDESPSSLFAIALGKQTMLRWIRRGSSKVYLVDERDLNLPNEWRVMPLDAEGRTDFVKAKILWLGEERQLRRR